MRDLFLFFLLLLLYNLSQKLGIKPSVLPSVPWELGPYTKLSCYCDGCRTWRIELVHWTQACKRWRQSQGLMSEAENWTCNHEAEQLEWIKQCRIQTVIIDFSWKQSQFITGARQDRFVHLSHPPEWQWWYVVNRSPVQCSACICLGFTLVPSHSPNMHVWTEWRVWIEWVWE